VEMLKTSCCINGAEGRPIACDLFFPQERDSEQRPWVVFSHGFKGFKDWGKWPLILHHIAKQGFRVCRFNFSHNGTTPENPDSFCDPEAFKHNTFSKELFDLGCVMNFLEQHHPAREGFVLIGHSRGGGISILKTAIDKRVKKLITWAAVCDFKKRIDLYPQDEWEQNGVVFDHNSRTRQQLPVGINLKRDLMANPLCNIEQAARKIEVPTLIIHGEGDNIVTPDEARHLHQWIKNSKLHLIAKANHAFDAVHPATDDILNDYQTNLLNTSLQFLHE
jgi:uncharacterized protein